MSIIGTVLGIIAIGLVFWLRKNQKMNFDLHDGDIYAARHAYEALMSDLNNYQIENERKIAALEKNGEIQNRNHNTRIDVANKRMDNMNKSLPSIIGQVVGQIEFAQDKLNRK
tara:strand:- start:146 stop:484 length:339 start_codon:yes stop_codon:yes gene_type:complete